MAGFRSGSNHFDVAMIKAMPINAAGTPTQVMSNIPISGQLAAKRPDLIASVINVATTMLVLVPIFEQQPPNTDA